jgi:hypothetical protein
MDWITLTAALVFVTLFGWIGIASLSKRAVQKRMDDKDARKSTLAADKSATGTPADI